MSLWKANAVRRLGTPGAPRVFGRKELADWLAQGGLHPNERTLLRALQEWEAQDVVGRPARGVYLNRQATPTPLLEDVAQALRPGAVVSLASVLGRAGVLNNPSYWITATLPSTAVKGPVDVQASDGTVFRFAYMRPDLIAQPDAQWQSDAVDDSAFAPTATPEKALLDWLYLSSSARGAARWPLPALHDLSLDELDADRLDRLAARMELIEPLAQLRQAIDDERPRVKVRRSRLR